MLNQSVDSAVPSNNKSNNNNNNNNNSSSNNKNNNNNNSNSKKNNNGNPFDNICQSSQVSTCQPLLSPTSPQNAKDASKTHMYGVDGGEVGCGYGLDDVDEAEYGTYDEDAHDLEGATLLQRTVSEGANNKVNSFVKISIRNFNEFSGFHTNFPIVISPTFILRTSKW